MKCFLKQHLKKIVLILGASSYCVFVVTKSFQSLGQARTNAIAIYNRGASQNLPVNSDNKENVQLQPWNCHIQILKKWFNNHMIWKCKNLHLHGENFLIVRLN